MYAIYLFLLTVIEKQILNVRLNFEAQEDQIMQQCLAFNDVSEFVEKKTTLDQTEKSKQL